MARFGGFITHIGIAQRDNAVALGELWGITHMLVGDAGGGPQDTPPPPSPDQTGLVNQVARRPLNALYVDPANPGVLIAEVILPPDIGGWWIRELGLEDADGNFVAVASCPPSYKPLLEEGSGRDQTVRMRIVTSAIDSIQLRIDPSVVLASRAWVDVRLSEEIAQAKEYAKDLLEQVAVHTHIGQPFPLMPGAPEPDPQYHIQLTAGLNSSGEYNHGKLRDEVIESDEGSWVNATAIIDDPESPMYGQEVDLVNTSRRAILPGESGVKLNDAMQRITGQAGADANIATFRPAVTSGAFSITPESLPGFGQSSSNQQGQSWADFDSANSPGARTDDHTRIRHIQAAYYMRIK